MMLTRRLVTPAALILLVVGVAAFRLGGPTAIAPAALEAARPLPLAQASSPQLARNPERNAYFGDLHVHTSWSLDAYSIGGNQKDDPTVAYRFGRGEAIRGSDGKVRGQLRVPLDFMAVTDHDAYLGESQICEDARDPAYNSRTCEDLRRVVPNAFIQKAYPFYADQLRHPVEICGDGAQDKCMQMARHLWQQIQKNAEDFYQPGRFTTFIGYEWTGQAKGTMTGGWLHRNVIFRGSKVPAWGGSAVEMKNQPERLWAWLQKACTGDCQALAIPHNSNFGMGLMLGSTNSDGTPFTPEILRLRAIAEPLIEIHQIKGNSECTPGLGTTDEDCNFEQSFVACKPGMEGRCAFASDYVRNALKTGLSLEQTHKVNPFKYGIIGSTDTHVSAPGSTEELPSWVGGMGQIGGPPNTALGSPGSNPGGLAGVWAEQNTREAIFDALKRRETFGTSGTRLRVRFFAGWKYPERLDTNQNLLKVAYAQGVPMGSDLPTKPRDAKAPRLIVWATKDPNSAALQRIQIVKGWFDGSQTFEKVFDVVCADGRAPDASTHRCAKADMTIDTVACAESGSGGAPELSTTWGDPEFNAAHRAFYYARVLEIPTCRWSTRAANASSAKAPTTVPAVIQERAWSSPIWYAPAP